MEAIELEGAELDAAVAKALGYTHHGAVGTFTPNEEKPWCLSEVNDWWKSPEGHWICGPCTGFPHAYSTEWEQGGPIIEREGISIMVARPRLHGICSAHIIDRSPLVNEHGPTPLIAAMRAFVASKTEAPHA